MRTGFSVLLAAAGLVIGFGSGYVVGHRSHHYAHLGAAGVLMYDETTGHICTGIAKSKNPIDAALPPGFVPDNQGAASDPWKERAQLLEKVKEAEEIPYCGEE